MFAETPACSEEENTISSFIFTAATCLQNVLPHGCSSLNVLLFSSLHITIFYNTGCLKLLSITQVLTKSIEQMQLSQLHVWRWTADLHQLRLCGPECSSFIWRQRDSQAIQPQSRVKPVQIWREDQENTQHKALHQSCTHPTFHFTDIKNITGTLPGCGLQRCCSQAQSPSTQPRVEQNGEFRSSSCFSAVI